MRVKRLCRLPACIPALNSYKALPARWLGGKQKRNLSRNSGQNKVAAQRATHLILSPRCGDLAGKPSLSSHIDALVPAALCSDFRRFLNGSLEANSRATRVFGMPCAEQLPQHVHVVAITTTPRSVPRLTVGGRLVLPGWLGRGQSNPTAGACKYRRYPALT